jgi:maltose O-acetyltransferase
MTLFQSVRIAVYRVLSTGHAEGNPLLLQPLLLVGEGRILMHGLVVIGYFPSPLFLSTYCHLEARGQFAFISIGDETCINNGFSAIAEHTSITIGKRVLIGTGVEILDSDFHGLNLNDRAKSLPDWAKPVVIEDDVFIGSNVRILKGVTIGRGSVIGNSAIVVNDIPRDVVAGGHPARAIRKILN